MKMFIHSNFGILECEPMTLQQIEKSITESEYAKNNQFSEVLVDAGPVDAVCCEELSNDTDTDEIADNEDAEHPIPL